LAIDNSAIPCVWLALTLCSASLCIIRDTGRGGGACHATVRPDIERAWAAPRARVLATAVPGALRVYRTVGPGTPPRQLVGVWRACTGMGSRAFS
jgi:hypothetical protein